MNKRTLMCCAYGLACCWLMVNLAWAQPKAQPPGVDAVLTAVVGISADIPGTARTAETLGTTRNGSGVVIDSNGLIVTIGYLILEALSVQLSLADGSQVPANIVAYDHNSGLGLVRAAYPLTNATPMPLGEATALSSDARVLVIAHGGIDAVRPATVVARRPFAGYWEYLLEDAIFTIPPHPAFSGAALVSAQGALLGIGSLVVGDALNRERPVPGNIFVPIDQLEAVLGDLLAHGRNTEAVHPWLGVYTEEYRGHLLISRVAEDSPAAASGLQANEIIVRLADQPVASLLDFYRRLWALGSAGVTVPLTILRAGQLIDLAIVSGDRYDWLRLKPAF